MEYCKQKEEIINEILAGNFHLDLTDESMNESMDSEIEADISMDSDMDAEEHEHYIIDLTSELEEETSSEEPERDHVMDLINTTPTITNELTPQRKMKYINARRKLFT